MFMFSLLNIVFLDFQPDLLPQMPATLTLGKGWHIWLGLHAITLWIVESSIGLAMLLW